ncbi:MAG: T9SS type A sorting domain-containing protein [Lewinellaceae bacterium]|nr:T9SS type A sorting domain-containing protein [Lewinellaceae bacterium]
MEVNKSPENETYNITDFYSQFTTDLCTNIIIYRDAGFSDLDGDGDQDIVLTGVISGWPEPDLCFPSTKIYLNEIIPNSTPNWVMEQSPTASIYPNPDSEGHVFIEYGSSNNTTLKISLFDLNGRMVQQIRTEVSSGINRIPFDTLLLPKGIYFFQIDDGIRVNSLKLIVQ